MLVMKKEMKSLNAKTVGNLSLSVLARSSFIGRRDLIISLSDARAAKMPRKSEWENLVDEVEDAVVVVVGEAVEVVGEEELVTHSNEESVRAEARVGMHTRVGEEEVAVVAVEVVEEDEVGEVEAGVVEGSAMHIRREVVQGEAHANFHMIKEIISHCLTSSLFLCLGFILNC